LMPFWKWGNSVMSRPVEVSRGAEKSNVMSLAAPAPMLRTTMLGVKRLV
jgi:hypothetical protein